MNNKVNENGSHLIAIPLLLVVIAIIGFAGWYVWDKNHESKNTQELSSTTQQAASTVTTKLPSISSDIPVATPTQSTKTSAEELTANWDTYTNTHFGYSVKYPQDWMIISDSELSVCFQDKVRAQAEPLINMPGVTPSRNLINSDLCISEAENYSSYLERIPKAITPTISLDLDLTGTDIQGFASTYYCWLAKYPQAPVNMGNEVINSQVGKIYVSSCRLDWPEYTTYYAKGFYVSGDNLLYRFSLKDNATEQEKNIYRLALSTFSKNN